MTFEENVRAILNSNFSETKDEIIDNAVKLICKLKLRGEWIEQGHYPFCYTCDQCNWISTRVHNFCPNCGANMEEAVQNETDN